MMDFSSQETGTFLKDQQEAIAWKASIPLLTNLVVLRQLLFVLVMSATCVLLFLLALEAIEGQLTPAGAWKYIWITMLILVFLAFLAVLVMALVYGNRYEYEFRVDESGVQAATSGRTRKKNRIINTLLVLSGRPGPAGAGLLAASRQSQEVKWKNIDQVTSNAVKKEIVLRRGRRAIMIIQCTTENFDRVLNIAQQAVKGK